MLGPSALPCFETFPLNIDRGNVTRHDIDAISNSASSIQRQVVESEVVRPSSMIQRLRSFDVEQIVLRRCGTCTVPSVPHKAVAQGIDTAI